MFSLLCLELAEVFSSLLLWKRCFAEVQTSIDLLSVTVLPALLPALFAMLQHHKCLQVHETFQFHEASGFLFENLLSLKEKKLTDVCLGFLDP